MREMKNTPERGDSAEGWQGEGRSREPATSRRGSWRDDEESARSGRNEREVLRYVPLYDPWGATERGNPYAESELWGNHPYGRSPYYHPGDRPSGNEPGPYGWAADYSWDRGRGYYGAGLAPWEAYEPPPNLRSERRWLDPSYYDHQESGPYYGPGEEGYAPRAYAPWSGSGSRRGNWW
ncbi:MAG: hypothetical protein HQM00_12735 [Magnetococcales bacterium]|nr:hypothetical protein [Magnetococcales bacterium]